MAKPVCDRNIPNWDRERDWTRDHAALVSVGSVQCGQGTQKGRLQCAGSAYVVASRQAVKQAATSSLEQPQQQFSDGLSLVNGQWSVPVVSGQWSVVSGQWSAVSSQPAGAVSSRYPAVSLSADGMWSKIAGRVVDHFGARYPQYSASNTTIKHKK